MFIESETLNEIREKIDPEWTDVHLLCALITKDGTVNELHL